MHKLLSNARNMWHLQLADIEYEMLIVVKQGLLTPLYYINPFLRKGIRRVLTCLAKSPRPRVAHLPPGEAGQRRWGLETRCCRTTGARQSRLPYLQTWEVKMSGQGPTHMLKTITWCVSPCCSLSWPCTSPPLPEGNAVQRTFWA